MLKPKTIIELLRRGVINPRPQLDDPDHVVIATGFECTTIEQALLCACITKQPQKPTLWD